MTRAAPRVGGRAGRVSGPRRRAGRPSGVGAVAAAATVMPGTRTLARATAGGAPAGASAGTPPVGTAAVTVAVPLAADADCTGTVSESGGGTMPGARTNFGDTVRRGTPDRSVGRRRRRWPARRDASARPGTDDPDEAPADAPVPAPRHRCLRARRRASLASALPSAGVPKPRSVSADAVAACVSVIELVLFVRLVGIARNRDEGYAIRQVHELDPHCVPVPRPPYRLHRSPDHATVGGDGEELIVRTDHHSADQPAATLR